MELIVGTLALARRLEASDARNAAMLAEAQDRLRPSTGACQISIGGATVAYAGPGSPLTHAIGAGMNGPVSGSQLDEIEAFYRERESNVSIDVCPLADPTLSELLGERGYRCVEFNSVMVRTVSSSVETGDARVERVDPGDLSVWPLLLAEGFFEHDPTEEEVELGANLMNMEDAVAFMIRVDGIPASGGAMALHPDRLATLFADATLKRFRGRGLQQAIIQARLAHAATSGADLATAATLPGTPSHRNYERCGFRVAYTKSTMLREFGDPRN